MQYIYLDCPLRRMFISLCLTVGALFFYQPTASAADVCGAPRWVEYESNPIIDPDGAGLRAYYPAVLYDPNEFSGHGEANAFKMWVDTEMRYYTSDDGISWTYVGNKGDGPITGLTPASVVRHPQMEYYEDGFSGQESGDPTMYYRLWYWDQSELYTIDALRYAESPDGKAWYNDQPLQQGTPPLIEGVAASGWNRGTYGVSDVLHNPAASNAGSNPFNYSFTMYYDGTSGGTESLGIAYSADAINWTGYSVDGGVRSSEILGGTFSSGDWDYDYVSLGTVRLDGSGFQLWYSGGTSGTNQGVGYATSPDGVIWTRDTENPILHVDDGLPWRTGRTYTPEVIEVDGGLRMYFTGQVVGDSDTRGIGYAYYYYGGCNLGDACYDQEVTNPYNVCQVCDIDRAYDDWSDNEDVACDDAIWCNGADSCLEGSCAVHADTPATRCPDDNLFCTGVEYCDEFGNQCRATGNPCLPTLSCDETTDSCLPGDGGTDVLPPVCDAGDVTCEASNSGGCSCDTVGASLKGGAWKRHSPLLLLLELTISSL